jgi:hypothetical protein
LVLVCGVCIDEILSEEIGYKFAIARFSGDVETGILGGFITVFDELFS